MKGISRIDSNHTHGWFVRVFLNAQTHSKMFSDGVHGGQDKALKAAIKYKDEYERKHPPSYAATRMRLQPMKNNTSGVVGVSETFSRSRNGNILPCFNVSWRPRPNVSRSKSFFLSKYGSREAAFEAAIKFRREREAEIIAGIES
ncbi:MAG: hypothetical protein HQ553_03385 [Chloroflexi bacterium]|nr:hypothetical protein [Chloroflexota bacterium]